MTPDDGDRLAELCARHALGEFSPLVTHRLDELFAAPSAALEATTRQLITACEHLGVTGERLEEVVARLTDGEAYVVRSSSSPNPGDRLTSHVHNPEGGGNPHGS